MAFETKLSSTYLPINKSYPFSTSKSTFVILSLKLFLWCGSLYLVPQSKDYLRTSATAPKSGFRETNSKEFTQKGIILDTGPLWTTLSNSNFQVLNKTLIICSFWCKIRQSRSSGWGSTAFERNWVRNIPFLTNTAQPLNRFSSFLYKNANFNVLVCTFNTDLEIMSRYWTLILVLK